MELKNDCSTGTRTMNLTAKPAEAFDVKLGCNCNRSVEDQVGAVGMHMGPSDAPWCTCKQGACSASGCDNHQDPEAESAEGETARASLSDTKAPMPLSSEPGNDSRV